MTLDEIRASDKTVLTPAEVAPVLGCDAQDLRVQARTAPDKLGFNVIIVGTRIKIPRVPFINYLTGGE